MAPEREPTHAFTVDVAWFDIGTAERDLDALAYELDGSVVGNRTVIQSKEAVSERSIGRCSPRTTEQNGRLAVRDKESECGAVFAAHTGTRATWTDSFRQKR